jgi:hypothetical protein
MHIGLLAGACFKACPGVGSMLSRNYKVKKHRRAYHTKKWAPKKKFCTRRKDAKLKLFVLPHWILTLEMKENLVST